MSLEIILLCIISGSLLQKINKNKKLLFTEIIIACIDVSCLLIAALTFSWQGRTINCVYYYRLYFYDG